MREYNDECPRYRVYVYICIHMYTLNMASHAISDRYQS